MNREKWASLPSFYTPLPRLNEEAGYKSAQNWPNFSRFPRAGEPSMEAGPKGKKKSRPIIFILICPTKIYTKT